MSKKSFHILFISCQTVISEVDATWPPRSGNDLTCAVSPTTPNLKWTFIICISDVALASLWLEFCDRFVHVSAVQMDVPFDARISDARKDV